MTTVTKDPGDNRAYMKGSGMISIGNGTLRMQGEHPRYYVFYNDNRQVQYAEPPMEGWLNIEMVAYARLVEELADDAPLFAGFSLIARSNHHLTSYDPCYANGYYARLYFRQGTIGFQKEYEHNENTGALVYSRGNNVRFVETVQKDKWYGMKFRVRNQGLAVLLEVYVDLNEQGDWKLMHSVLDDGTNMLARSATECLDGGTFPQLSFGQVSFLRTDDAVVEWKNVSFREINEDGSYMNQEQDVYPETQPPETQKPSTIVV